VVVDIAVRYRLTVEDWAAAAVLRRWSLAVEVLVEHHEYAGLCAGCLAHCRQQGCVPPPPITTASLRGPDTPIEWACCDVVRDSEHAR
jgi:hypothetical protein